MRYWLVVLLFIPFGLRAQFPVGSWKRASYIYAGEYRPIGYDSLNHQTYYYPSVGGAAVAFTGQPAYCQSAWGGPHDYGETDTLGGLYFSGSNEAGQDGTGSTGGTSITAMTHVTVDSAGVTIPPVAQILLTGVSPSPYWANTIVTTYATGGKVGVSGSLQQGLRGNGTSGATTQPAFVWVPILNGDTIVKVTGLYSIIALTSAGRLQSWGYNNYSYALGQGGSPVSNAPGYVSLPSGWTCYDVTSNGVATWAACDSANHTYHKLFTWGWQYDPAYQGRGSAGTGYNVPTDVSTNNFCKKMFNSGARWPVKLASNSESYYFICNDGTLWSIGGNAIGTIGNGQSMNLASVNWFYNQGQNQNNQDTIYNVAPGTTNWVNVYEENVCFS